MEHNLMPPFIMREAGLQVSEVPKTHAVDPTAKDHCACSASEDLWIPMSLHGAFSYFPSSKPADEVLNDCDTKIMHLTPEGPWKPNSTTHSENEDSMLDFQGEFTNSSPRQSASLEDIASNEDMSQGTQVSSSESNRIDSLIDDLTAKHEDLNLHTKLQIDSNISQHKISIGSTAVLDQEYL